MLTVTLQAHFDGERTVLDEPFDLLADTPLMVTVLASPDRADPAEDIYTPEDGEPWNHAG